MVPALRMSREGRSRSTNLLRVRIRVSRYKGIGEYRKILGFGVAKGCLLAEYSGNRSTVQLLFEYTEAAFLEGQRASKGSSFERSLLKVHGVSDGCVEK